MTDRIKLIAAALLVAVFCCALIALGYAIGRPSAEVVSVEPAPAQSLPSGAVVLERKPETQTIKPIKRGTTVQRQVTATIQPSKADCPPVTVDLQLVKDADGDRAVVRSQDGTVIGGLDVQAASLKIDVPRVWAAGLSCDPARCRDTAGAWLDRDLGRVRVGAEVLRESTGKPAARVRLGWSW